jgi:hypothetical protein
MRMNSQARGLFRNVGCGRGKPGRKNVALETV